MEPACLRHTELPRTTRLFGDFLYHFDRVAAFYEASPHDFSSFSAAAAQIRYPDEQRAALVAALRQQNGDSPALDLLARPGTAVVATGQQVGLFSGPAYTIYKALTVAKLAQRLSERGIPAVPVFWLATEDHDFAEVNHCYAFDAACRPVRLETTSLGDSRRPVGRIETTDCPAAGLRSALAGFTFGQDVADVVESAYAPGRRFGDAFADLLKKLLPAHGLLYLDPLHQAIRGLAAPMLRQALEAGPELVRLVLDRNRALEAAGYHAQVHVEPESSLLFLLDGGRRLPLRRADGGYIAGESRFSIEELTGRGASLSPNALLRPVIQDYILPTVAYVGGPAEVAYLAQSHVLHRALLGRMPVAVHRGSFTLLDARGEKLLRRYGLSLPDFFHGEDAVRERIAAKLVPPVLQRALEAVRAEADDRITRLGTELMSFDPTLAAALDKSRAKILYQFSKIGRKVARESLRRSERAAQEASYLSGLVYPEKHFQERLYSILPFLAKHGFDLIARIYENVHLDCLDHRLLVV